VCQSELGDGWDLFDHVVAVVNILRDEGTRVAGEDADRPGRVDQQAGDVLVQGGRERMNEM